MTRRMRDQCPEQEGLIARYAYGDCDYDERQRFTAHLEECEVCARKLVSVRMAIEAMDSWGPPPLETHRFQQYREEFGRMVNATYGRFWWNTVLEGAHWLGSWVKWPDLPRAGVAGGIAAAAVVVVIVAVFVTGGPDVLPLVSQPPRGIRDALPLSVWSAGDASVMTDERIAFSATGSEIGGRADAAEVAEVAEVAERVTAVVNKAAELLNGIDSGTLPGPGSGRRANILNASEIASGTSQSDDVNVDGKPQQHRVKAKLRLRGVVGEG